MFRGNVERATRTVVQGWAARLDEPNARVQISIFVDGNKVAQAPCAQLRPDLQNRGTFGDGGHGFRYQFPQPLPEGEPRRISVRFTDTGGLLRGGDIELRADATTVVRPTERSSLLALPGPLPAPASPRGLFELLTLLDETSDLFDLVSKLDLGGMTRSAVRLAILGEADPVDGAPADDTSPLHEVLHQFLMSDEFQANVIPRFLKSFPEKSRLIFIHIPKCAGTDLAANLAGRFPSMHRGLSVPAWTPKPDLFRALSRLARIVPFFERMFVTGHQRLSFYTAHGLVRPQDRLFTIVRDPTDIAISHINYVLTRLFADAAAGTFRPDTTDWLRLLKLDRDALRRERADIPALCHLILRHKAIVRPNSMCYFLGGDTADLALQQLVSHDVEVTTMRNYNRWLRETWGIESERRLNSSEKFTSFGSLSPADQDYIRDSVTEDAALFAAISAAADCSGTASVRGTQLLQHAA